MYDPKLIVRLKKSEGQLRGIQKMIEDNRECTDIISQLTAVRSSVDRVAEMIISEYLRDCLENPLEDPLKQRQRIKKAVQYLLKKI